MARTDRASASGSKKARQRTERRREFAPAVPRATKRAVGRTTTEQTPLHVRTRGVEIDDETRAYVRSRIGFKLGKYALHVTRISVRLEDVGGPTGAPEYACKVKVVLPGTREVVVASNETTPRAAFDTAADATERAVRRLLERSRQGRTR